jgi:hypothetical protein
MASRRIRQFAIVSLIIGAFSLRASLSSPPSRYVIFQCSRNKLISVVWTPQLTLNYTGCGYTSIMGPFEVFYMMTACGAVMTLYGAVILFRHGLP